MKKILSTFAAVCLVWASVNAQTLLNQKDTASYALGVLFAQNFQDSKNISIDASKMAQGFSDALSGQAKISPEVANQIFSAFMAEAQKSQFAGAIEKGRKFLEENGKRAGVTTTASGLQYEVIVAGTGVKPTATDKVTTHYHGTLLDGRVFDSSVQRGQPIDFPVNGVIAGWTEALQLMPTGSKWRLFIPYNLAYGERGAGGMIGPYETLIFEVELIKVN